MTEHLIKPRRTAADELSEMIFGPKEEHRRVPLIIDKQQYAVEFFDTLHSLTAAVWSYHRPIYQWDHPEVLEGAIKFTKDTDETLVKYSGLDHNYDIRLFAEGLTKDRPCEAEDLERFQPKIEAAINLIQNG
jgi:hypothetical protein